MQFQKKQLSLIKKSKEFLNRKDSKDACNNAFTYLSSFSNTPGKALLRYWLYGLKDIFNITKIFIKDLAVTSRLSNFKTYGEFNEAKEILIISWSSLFSASAKSCALLKPTALPPPPPNNLAAFAPISVRNLLMEFCRF